MEIKRFGNPVGKKIMLLHGNLMCWRQFEDASGGAVFFAAGVFYYFLKRQVKTLVQAMANTFPGGVPVFDAARPG